ncbi:MAG TPA: hydrolase [Steroidobacteraceae bacterium]|nr:hydrolase [Steroidobacteraceae bacterium]
MIELDPRISALVLIDLQKGILGYSLTPVTSQELLERGRTLAERFRSAKATVVLVNVAFSPDGADMLRQPVDQAQPLPAGGFPAGWSECPSGLMQTGDLQVTKRQWGAFHGTELDLQLRRRGIRTIVLGGVATHIGVESTARQAYERGYELLIVKDATTSSDAEAHAMSMKHIMPRLARVVQSNDITLTRT